MKKLFYKLFFLLITCFILSCSNPSGGNSTDTLPEAPQVSVSFNKNSDLATGSMKNLTGKSGSTVSIPACSFTYSNYSFVSWNTKSDGSGTRYNPNDTYVLTNTDLVLYAQWKNLSSSEPEPNPEVNDSWDGAGYYIFTPYYWDEMFYIAKFDEDKNLLSKNYDNELSYVFFNTDKAFRCYKTDPIDFDSFKEKESKWKSIKKLTEAEIEESYSNALWFFNEKQLEENAIYYAEYEDWIYYFEFNGTSLKTSKPTKVYSTCGWYNESPKHEFIWRYDIEDKVVELLENHINFKKINDEDLPKEIYRAFRVEEDREAYYKYSYTSYDGSSVYTCYTRYYEAANTFIAVLEDQNKKYSYEFDSYEKFVAYKDFSIVKEDDLPLTIQNVFIKGNTEYYSYEDDNNIYYAAVRCTSRGLDFREMLRTIFGFDKSTREYFILDEYPASFFEYALNATGKIKCYTGIELESIDEKLFEMFTPYASEVYNFTNKDGNTVYASFNSFKYSYALIVKDNNGNAVYEPIKESSIVDWPQANLMDNFRKMETGGAEDEIDSLPDVIRYYVTDSYYNQFSKGTVFKFYVKDGYTYYANYLKGRYGSPYIAKSSDGTTFIKVEYNEINELSLPESFDEIVFLKDFEATDIDYSLIKDAE